MKIFPTLRRACVLALIGCTTLNASLAHAADSTRMDDAAAAIRMHSPPKGFKSQVEFVLGQLDLRPGDVVADIGAGEGVWAEPMARVVGSTGTIHAGEVDQKKVDRMKEKFADLSQLRPYLCPTNSPGLPDGSCDMAFFSESYHHLGKDAQIGYLKGLRSTLKPTGRVVIIERYTEIRVGQGEHGTRLSRLIQEAEDAGWVPVQSRLIPETYHYIVVLAQKELFPPEPKRDNTKKGAPKKKR